MRNVLKHNNDINIQSWQTFISYYDNICSNSKNWIHVFIFTYLLIYMSYKSAYCTTDTSKYGITFHNLKCMYC
jgi:hypothetical protein